MYCYQCLAPSMTKVSGVPLCTSCHIPYLEPVPPPAPPVAPPLEAATQFDSIDSTLHRLRQATSLDPVTQEDLIYLSKGDRLFVICPECNEIRLIRLLDFFYTKTHKAWVFEPLDPRDKCAATTVYCYYTDQIYGIHSQIDVAHFIVMRNIFWPPDSASLADVS